MTYTRYALQALASLIFTLLAYILNPFVVLFCAADGTLPVWLKWFETFDAPSCDTGWRDGYFGTFAQPPTGVKLWWLRTRWLWRNPAYGFNYWPLGIVMNVATWTIHTVTFNPDGSVRTCYATDTAGHFCYMGARGAKIGWKLLNYVDHWDGTTPVWKTQPWGPEWRTMLAFTPFSFPKLFGSPQ